MGAALPIADHHEASALRALVRREKNGRVAPRMVEIANTLDGMTRLAAAWSVGMDRQDPVRLGDPLQRRRRRRALRSAQGPQSREAQRERAGRFAGESLSVA